MKNKPITLYVTFIILFTLGSCTLINLTLDIFHIYTFTNFLSCFSINITLVPLFIIEFTENQFSLPLIIGYAILLVIILVYFTFTFLLLGKKLKIINGLIIFITVIDLLFSYGLIFGNLLVGILNIFFKIVLLYCCIKNIKWYNENYEIFS